MRPKILAVIGLAAIGVGALGLVVLGPILGARTAPLYLTARAARTMFGYPHAAWGLGGWLGILAGLLVLIGLVLLIIWAVSAIARASRPATPPTSRPQPLEMLRERFARGDISEAEFEQARRILGL